MSSTRKKAKPPGPYAKCRTCGAEIIWGKSYKDALQNSSKKAIPLDVAGAELRAVRFGNGEYVRVTWTYTVHHATCPQGKDWKGKKRGDADEPTPEGSVVNYALMALAMGWVVAPDLERAVVRLEGPRVWMEVDQESLDSHVDIGLAVMHALKAADAAGVLEGHVGALITEHTREKLPSTYTVEIISEDLPL